MPSLFLSPISDGQYIVAGSDDGYFFIFNRKTTNIVNVIKADECIVNCVQPHHSSCFLATSGIDNNIKLWQPSMSVSASLGGLLGIENLSTLIRSHSFRFSINPNLFFHLDQEEKLKEHEKTLKSLIRQREKENQKKMMSNSFGIMFLRVTHLGSDSEDDEENQGGNIRQATLNIRECLPS